MRVALKVAYLGTGYHGFQIQPNVPTIQGEIVKALSALGVIEDMREARFQCAGRTDKDVHAVGQVIAFDTDEPKMALPRVINKYLPDGIRMWSRAEVPDDFSPRYNAVSREYRYLLPETDLDISRVRRAADMLVGEHDFANFAVKEEGRSTIRRVKKVNVRMERGFMSFEIEADSFLWRMVRKIVTALTLVGSGARDVEWLENMLNPQSYEEGIEPALSYGLLLKNVRYDGVDWIDDEYAKKQTMSYFHKTFLWHGTMAEVIDDIGHYLTGTPIED